MSEEPQDLPFSQPQGEQPADTQSDETRSEPGDEQIAPSAEVDSAEEMYTFDPEKFDTETDEDVKRHKEWAGRSAHWSEPERLRTKILEIRQDRALLRHWSETYSDKVPKHWGEVQYGAPWHAILDDIENPETQLTQDMVEAAAVYPIAHVPIALGESRRLSPEQLDKMQDTGFMPAYDMEQVRQQQASMHQPEPDAA